MSKTYLMGTVQPSLHYKYMQRLVLYTVCLYCNIHVPAGACIPVASASPLPVQLVHAPM